MEIDLHAKVRRVLCCFFLGFLRVELRPQSCEGADESRRLTLHLFLGMAEDDDVVHIPHKVVPVLPAVFDDGMTETVSPKGAAFEAEGQGHLLIRPVRKTVTDPSLAPRMKSKMVEPVS